MKPILLNNLPVFFSPLPACVGEGAGVWGNLNS
jgi:hypothetical protein